MNRYQEASTEFVSTHKLDFLVAPWEFMDSIPVTPPFKRYRVGTCHGLWRCADDCYEILSVINDEKGNGHLQDVIEWFENSCRRDNKNLRMLHFENLPFMIHMINHFGFEREKEYDIIKMIAK